MASHGGVLERKIDDGVAHALFQSPVWQAMAVYPDLAYFLSTSAASFNHLYGKPWRCTEHFDVHDSEHGVSITCMASHGGVLLRSVIEDVLVKGFNHLYGKPWRCTIPLQMTSGMLIWFQSPVWQAMAVYFFTDRATEDARGRFNHLYGKPWRCTEPVVTEEIIAFGFNHLYGKPWRCTSTHRLTANSLTFQSPVWQAMAVYY